MNTPIRTRGTVSFSMHAGMGAPGWNNAPLVPSMFDKRLLFVTGKGGVGKTTVALAMGLAAAKAGKRTIVCEVASQEHASRIFNRGEVGFHEVSLRDNLWAISIDPDRSMREYLELQLKVKAMGDLLSRSRIFQYLAAATPGLKELVTVGKIWELAQLDRKVKKGRKYDLVIVDAPATGHGIGFLQTPKTFAGIARVGPIASQGEQISSFIKDHSVSGAVIVALPEEMPVNESHSLERGLVDEVGIEVDKVLMNGLYPKLFKGKEVTRLDEAVDEAEGAPRAAIRAALSQAQRADGQRAQLKRLKKLVDAPVEILPFVFAPEIEEAELELLAQAVMDGSAVNGSGPDEGQG